LYGLQRGASGGRRLHDVWCVPTRQIHPRRGTGRYRLQPGAVHRRPRRSERADLRPRMAYRRDRVRDRYPVSAVCSTVAWRGDHAGSYTEFDTGIRQEGRVTHVLTVDVRKPPMTLNEQRRAHWQQVRRAKAEAEQHIWVVAKAARLPRMKRAHVEVVWFAPDKRRRDADALSPFLKET